MANSLFIVYVWFGLFLQHTNSQSVDQEWGEWSPCSRSCGVGVTYQDRKCQDVTDLGSCLEPKRNYRTCNIQDCPAGSGDFRYEQCARFNDRTLQDKKYNWVPHIPESDVCTLNCMPKGEYFYYRWAAKVVDGTRCSPDSYDICVDGKCESLGCDLIMHSKAKEDKCRVCNGDGRNCRTITGKFTEVGDGYRELVVIPSSATNILISEDTSAGHFLALADSKGDFFFNGNFDVTNPRTYKIAGSLFRYERSSSGKEAIQSLGPISQPIHAFILLRHGHKNPGVSYEYSVPKSTEIPTLTKFSWKTSNFGICSATCAGGYQYRKITCVRDRDNKIVLPHQCVAKTRPNAKRACDTQPCPPRWFISGWSACSTTCGQGKQVRRVHCEQEVQGGDSAMIPDEQCKTAKPAAMRVCSEQRYCPVWRMTKWSTCSASCGEGSITRLVRCQQVSGSTRITDNKYLADESCDINNKPTSRARCNLGPCTVKWIASNWSPCYPKCGPGISTRMVYCVSVSDDQQKYPDTLCDKRTKPANRKNCSSSDACPAMWHGSQWSRCTSSCGTGMQMRNVICAVREGNILRIISRDNCKATNVMPSVRKCFNKPCHASWYIYPWQPCSKSCGMGIWQRNVKCFGDSVEIPDERWCDQKTKPARVSVCIVRNCKTDSKSTKKPTTERPTTEKPTTELPTTKKTTTERPTTKKPTTQRPTTKKPTTQRSTTKKPTTQRTTTKKTTTERPTTKKPTTQRSTTKKATTQRTTTKKTTTQRPTTKKTTQRPTTKKSTTQRPTTKKSTTQRPTTKKPTTQRTTTEKTTQRPATKKTTTERPTTKAVIKNQTQQKNKKLPTTESPSTRRVTKRYPESSTREERLRITIRPTTIKQIPAKIEEVPRDVVTFINSEVFMRCRATGSPRPKISWRKDMLPVSSLGDRYSILDDGTLRITQVRTDDEGTYTCFAGNFVGQMDTSSAILTVIVPISVKIEPSNRHQVSVGDQVVLNCNVKGKPAPRVFWYKDGSIFYVNSQRISTRSKSLTIKGAQTSDSGRYECRAAHNYGQAADLVILTVKGGGPVIPTTLPVCEDDRAVAHCSLVKSVGYCKHVFYQRACCKTCSASYI